MKVSTLLILFLILGGLFIGACTTGNAPANSPPPSSGGGCGVSSGIFNPEVQSCNSASIEEVPVN